MSHFIRKTNSFPDIPAEDDLFASYWLELYPVAILSGKTGLR